MRWRRKEQELVISPSMVHHASKVEAFGIDGFVVVFYKGFMKDCASGFHETLKF